MGSHEDNEIRIANYLDDRMSPAEQEAFMQELGENEDLRRQYEDELLMYALLRERGAEDGAAADPGNNGLFLQPADEHIDMIAKALEKKTGEKEIARVVPLYRRYGWVAAAALVIIAGAIYMLATRNTHVSAPIAATPGGFQGTPAGPVDTPGRVIPVNPTSGNPASGNPEKTGPTQAPVIVKGTTGTPGQTGPDTGTPKEKTDEKREGDSLFASNYTPYSSTNDPVQVSLYYRYYKVGQYDKVLAATDASAGEMGSNEKMAVSIQYLHLYKGLAYLAKDQAANAIPEFDRVLQSAGVTDAPYYESQWYGTLARLKASDHLRDAIVMARQIVQTASPYKDRAVGLLKGLHAE